MKEENKTPNWQESYKKCYDDNESGGSSRWLVTPDTLGVMIEGWREEARKEVLKEWLKKLPKVYEDNKLGRTDLTLNEMFERGYNSCLSQIKTILNQI